MSWFARSIANTFKFDEEDETDEHEYKDINKDNTADRQNDDEQQPDSPASPGQGVKEDLSELTKTLTRQFWGVASFLAPPPPTEHSPPSELNPHEPSDASTDLEASGPEAISGIRNDFAEIGGRFRSGISKLSSNMAVSEITKIASNFLQLGPEEGDYDAARGAVGVTDEVVAFVRDITMHPETWLDFPLPEDEDDEDFDLSDAQQEHALAVEHLAPRLAALRIELCPGYMSEGSFWKIYFVLLHPRLGRRDAELLSTPEIVKARASLTHELQNRKEVKPDQEGSKSDTSYSKDMSTLHEESLYVPSDVQFESVTLEKTTLPSSKSADSETEKHPVLSNEIQIIDKSVIEEGPKNQTKDQNLHSVSASSVAEAKDEDDGDDWLKEESSEIVGSSGNTIPIENDEDVSFSDLEEDDGDVPTSYKKMTYCSDSSTKDSRDWVQLGRSSADSTKDIDCVTIERAGSGQVSVHNSDTKESNDWLDVDDIDVA